MHVATVAVPVIATLASAALARAFYVKNFGYCRTQAHALSDESVDQGEGGAITGYQVERRGQTGSWSIIAASTSTPFNDTTASDVTGTVYKYRVSAINPAGIGRASLLVKHTRP